MIENRSSLFGIIALIIGASGLGLGIFSVVSSQVLEGPEGPSGEDGIEGIDGIDGIDGIEGINGTDGIDGIDGPPGPVNTLVGILNPDNGEQIWGNITIDALIYSSDEYDVSILLNGSSIGEALPLLWNSSTVAQGWWNITVLVIDSNQNVTQDTVIVRVDKNAHSGVQRTWYNEYIPAFNTNPADQYLTIDALTIIFDIRAGESAYFLYNCIAYPIASNDIYIYFVLDEFRIVEPYCWVSNTAAQNQLMPVSLQYSNSSLSVGSHNITITVKGSSSFGAVLSNTLLVQTYIP